MVATCIHLAKITRTILKKGFKVQSSYLDNLFNLGPMTKTDVKQKKILQEL